MEISSLNNKLIVYAASLKEKKYRDKENKFLIEGEHLIEMASNIETIFTTIKDYKHKEAEVIYVNDAILKKLSSVEAPQKAIAIVSKKKDEINYNLNSYLLCDGVADPGNMGTIIRTALAFKIDMVILANGSVDIYNDKVIRGSQGAIFKIKVCYGNLVDIIKKLKENDVKSYASTLSSRSIDLKEIKKINKFALIVGNEGSGVTQEVLDASDYNIKIMHSTAIDSLNVGVATSIMLYYFDTIK